MVSATLLHRDKMVAGICARESAINKNTSASAGSSNVFNNALAASKFIRFAGLIKTTRRPPRCEPILAKAANSRICEIRICWDFFFGSDEPSVSDAPAESASEPPSSSASASGLTHRKSGCWPALNHPQESQTPQADPSERGLLQSQAAATSLPKSVLPIPAGP